VLAVGRHNHCTIWVSRASDNNHFFIDKKS
jgi:hypothetical protein